MKREDYLKETIHLLVLTYEEENKILKKKLETKQAFQDLADKYIVQIGLEFYGEELTGHTVDKLASLQYLLRQGKENKL